MVMNQKGGKGRGLNFDLNLVPFIDILSTCICFLLITAVFLQLGTLNVKQALGDGAAANSDKAPALWLQLQGNGDIVFSVKNVSGQREFTISGQGQQANWPEVTRTLESVAQKYPELKVALIMPHAQSRYADLIHLMDEVKKGAIEQVGISPL